MTRRIIVAVLAVALAGCSGPTCEERGGEEQFAGFMPMVIMAGKVPVTQLIPTYECVFVKERK